MDDFTPTLLPDGTAHVPLVFHRGEAPEGSAAIDQWDLASLQARGITFPWFFSTATQRVLAKNAEGREIPVSAMIMRPYRGMTVSHKDGDNTNLIRSNLLICPIVEEFDANG
jgi:hypothetical protein